MSLEGDLNRGLNERNIQVWIPADLHAAFKAKCAADRRTMRGAVVRFIMAYTGYKRQTDVPGQTK